MTRILKLLNKAGLRLRTRSTVAPALAPAPLLHSIGGGGNWDEIIAFLVAIGGFGYYTGRQKNKRRGRKRRRRPAKR